MQSGKYTTLAAGTIGGLTTVALCRWFVTRCRQARAVGSRPKPTQAALPPEIEALHVASISRGEETYTDPATGFTVFTAIAHNKRGYCCGSKCRHCPYGHTNVGHPDSVKRDREDARGRKKEGKAAKASVYTRGGDKGTSALFSGERFGKDELVFDALGCIDECNSAVGIAMEFCMDAGNGLEEHLKPIQGKLMDVGSFVATPRSTSSDARIVYTAFEYDEVTAVEQLIDELNAKLPICRAFILPTGGRSSSHLHMARCVCRRAERTLVKHYKNEPGLPVLKYMNRLSDLLFVMARFAAQHDGREDVWRPDRGLPKPQ